VVAFRALLATLALAGCTSINAGPASFEGTNWRVAAIDGQATPATDNYRLEFSAGRAGGRFGCNRFVGTYVAAGNTISFGPMIATRMACADPAMSFENNGLKVLQQPVALNWSSANRLELSNSAGSIKLERIR
jgi:heat shock protein HslJ